MIAWTLYICDWVNFVACWACWAGEWAIYAAVAGTVAREWLGTMQGETLTLKIGGMAR